MTGTLIHENKDDYNKYNERNRKLYLFNWLVYNVNSCGLDNKYEEI